MNPPENVMIFRLVLAAVLGSMVGWERERHNRPAGLRTHALVCLGSALITLVSQSFSAPGQDPSRISAQIVSGIGFLGAGTILRVRDSNIIRGLTTAASLWTVCGIGMAVGRGGSLYLVAVAATVIVIIVLTTLDWLEHRFITKLQYRRLHLGYVPESGRETEALQLLRSMGLETFRIERTPSENDEARLTVDVRIPGGIGIHEVEEKLLEQNWIRRIEWE
jgi:putative Mg2+ transporter-C (MgtC) family protein